MLHPLNRPPALARFSCLAAALLWISSAATGQEVTDIPEFITDRPDQTESSAVVPRGYFQIETGVTYSDEGSESRTLEYPGTLIRIGLPKRLELRLGTQGFVSEFEGNETTGYGDSEIGTKLYLWQESGWRPEAAFLASVSIPTGNNSFSTRHADPSFRFLFSHSLTETVSLAYNVGAAWETVTTSSGNATLSDLQYTLAAGFALTDRIGAFAELFGATPVSSGGGSAVSVDGGLTYLLRPNVQFDVALGAGVTDDAPDWFLTAGVSFRLPGWGPAKVPKNRSGVSALPHR